VQEIVQGRIRGRPGGLIIEGAAGRGGELAEVERRVATLPAVVDQAPHDAVVLPGAGRGRDGQQQRLLTLPGSGGHGLEGVVGDDMKLVDDGHAGIPALQGTRVGREGHERGVGVRLLEVILEYLHPAIQGRVEFHHPPGRVQDDPRLPLVAGDHQHLGALHPIGQQPVQPEGGGQGGFPVPSRDRHQRLPRAGLIHHRMDNLPLPRSQLEAMAGTRALGDGHVPLNEPDGPGTSPTR
jgi:hypothetical protein